MPIKVVAAQAHKDRLHDPRAKKELSETEALLREACLPYTDGTVNLVLVKGTYLSDKKVLLASCLLVNKTDMMIGEVHGKIHFSFSSEKAFLPTAVLDFDEDFLGCLRPDEALYIQIALPVRGILHEAFFYPPDLGGVFDDIRITPYFDFGDDLSY